MSSLSDDDDDDDKDDTLTRIVFFSLSLYFCPIRKKREDRGRKGWEWTGDGRRKGEGRGRRVYRKGKG